MHDDDLWRLDQGMRTLQEFRSHIRGVWQDSASQAINSRYLEPHDEEAGALSAALGRQQGHAEAAQRHAEQASEHQQDALRAEEQLLHLREQAHTDMQTAYTLLRSSDRLVSDTLRCFDQAYDLILQAGSSCGEDEALPVTGEMFRLPGSAPKRQQVSRSQAVQERQYSIGGAGRPATPQQPARSFRKVSRSSQQPGRRTPRQILTDCDNSIPKAIRDYSDRFRPGAFAVKSLPAHGGHKDLTPTIRKPITKLGQRYGCHCCGSKDPKTKSGLFIPDHIPPTNLWLGVPQRLLPHCLDCSRSQGGTLSGFKRKR